MSAYVLGHERSPRRGLQHVESSPGEHPLTNKARARMRQLAEAQDPAAWRSRLNRERHEMVRMLQGSGIKASHCPNTPGLYQRQERWPCSPIVGPYASRV
jgi:hypothetical protein